MEKKHVLAGMGVVLLVVGALLWPSVRWMAFGIQAASPVEKLGRFPEAPQILALPEQLREVARKVKMDPAKLTVRLGLEERGVMGGIVFTYVLVECSDGERTWAYSSGSERGRRIETSLTGDFLNALREGGVDLSKMER